MFLFQDSYRQGSHILTSSLDQASTLAWHTLGCELMKCLCFLPRELNGHMMIWFRLVFCNPLFTKIEKPEDSRFVQVLSSNSYLTCPKCFIFCASTLKFKSLGIVLHLWIRSSPLRCTASTCVVNWSFFFSKTL